MLIIYDIEVLSEIFLFLAKKEDGSYLSFELSKERDEISSLIKFISDEKPTMVGFNNLSYDGQVIEYLLRNNDILSLSKEEILKKLVTFSDRLIEGERPYISLSTNQVDLFRIHHLNNKNLGKSLKEVEAFFGMDVEEMPEITSLEVIRQYCKNDVEATFSLYNLTIGKTDHPLYKGQNKIEDRLVISAEIGVDCTNLSDVDIGSVWNKVNYEKRFGSPKPFKAVYPFGKRFRQFFPRDLEFKHEGIKRFLKTFGDSYIINKKQEFKLNIEGLNLTFGKGGLHSDDPPRFIKPKEDEVYLQVDISSQYPSAIVRYRIEPPHLPGWSLVIKDLLEKRKEWKKMRNNPRFESMQKMAKYALNGGSFGRLNTETDWQFYPEGLVRVTVACQIQILWIIENVIKKGMKVMSVNTDGFDVLIKRDRENEFREMLHEIQQMLDIEFELTEFKWIAQLSVNDYIALTNKGTKEKGEFCTVKELTKSISCLVVPKAIKSFLLYGTDISESIRKASILDLCIVKKCSRDFHFEGISRKGRKTYKRVIRYIVTKDPDGEKLLKVKNKDSMSGAPEITQLEAGSWLCKVVNKLPKEKENHNVNYKYYEQKTEQILRKMGIQVYTQNNQLSLW